MSRSGRGGPATWREPAPLSAAELALTDWPLLSAVLHARGVTTSDAVARFLAPRRAPLADPLLLPDMARAADSIRAAIARGTPIAVFGDYDVDGISSTAMLTRVLRRLGATVTPMIPHRMDDGYGVNPRTVERVRASGVGLLVTVDCGSSSPSEFAALCDAGVESVILDHHNYAGSLPDDCAFVSPKRPDNRFPFREFAAVGVAYQLVRVLLGDADAEMYLPYVVLGTIADVVDVTDENRALVARGLPLLRRWRLPGFMALCAEAGIDQAAIDTEQIGYAIGPRLNAAGRIDTPQTALDLLLADDAATATPLALALGDLNRQRQEETSRIQREAAEQIVATGASERPAIVVGAPGWSVGLVGLVASRIAETYARPAVVFELHGDEARGSARSAGDVDLVAALAATAPLLTRWGGHRAAAGLSLPVARLDQFRHELEATVLDLCGGMLPERVLTLDADASHDDLHLDTVGVLDQLAPFGRANEQPLLRVRGLGHRYAKTSRDGKHLIFRVVDRYGDMHRAVFFGAGDRLRELLATPAIDVATTLTRDRWDGRTSLKLQIADFRPSG